MKTILQINRPYVHGSVQVSWIGEVLSRLHVHSESLTVNALPIVIEGVVVRGRFDEWRWESFQTRRVAKKPSYNAEAGGLKTSRRNQERAREVILSVVSEWAGGRPQDIQPLRAIEESRQDGAALVELLGASL